MRWETNSNPIQEVEQDEESLLWNLLQSNMEKTATFDALSHRSSSSGLDHPEMKLLGLN